jgi:hypothetical protein
VDGVVGRMVLEQVFVSEIFEEIFSSIFLQCLCEGRFQWLTSKSDKGNSYLHMMEYGSAERHEITMDGV